MEDINAVELKQDLAISEAYSLTMRSSKEFGVRYYSNHDSLPGARTLSADEIQVVVTPQMTAVVFRGLEPRIEVVTKFPEAEKPDYRGRFAHDVRILSNAVARAVSHLNADQP